MLDTVSMLKVYFVAGTQDCRHLDGSSAHHLLTILQQALEAGITCFQFRDKGEHSLSHQPEQQRQLAFDCLQLCRRYQVPFIVNDDIELALRLRADGIHIGQQDNLSQALAAKRATQCLLGLSINNLPQALKHQHHPDIDYFGVGPIFATASKADHSPALSPDFMLTLRQAGINKPCVAIGGIQVQHSATLRHNGADGVAVISAITQARDIAAVVRQLRG